MVKALPERKAATSDTALSSKIEKNSKQHREGQFAFWRPAV